MDWLEKGGNQILEEPQSDFPIKNRQLYYKESRLSIADNHCQVNIIYGIHKWAGDTGHSEAMPT